MRSSRSFARCEGDESIGDVCNCLGFDKAKEPEKQRRCCGLSGAAMGRSAVEEGGRLKAVAVEHKEGAGHLGDDSSTGNERDQQENRIGKGVFLADEIQQEKVKDGIVLAGDSHRSFSFCGRRSRGTGRMTQG
ncbi:unnamed protein product [Lactuca saligna]|uniref:Uncharacterized protein n=1 Tax=Lactuca saligna TaxID=75948 RepID=A0AA35ZTE4_LACSI|nr:unnamed protein product [Lactuca saligna]